MKKLESLFNFWLPSPLQAFSSEETEKAGLDVWVKRDDLIHHHISGNKYRKLKQHFIEFSSGRYDEIVAFGGAFSNLLYSLAFIVQRTGIKTTFYIRGDGFDPQNPTLRVIAQSGARMIFLDRKTYREKANPAILKQILKAHRNPYVIPEGGSNELAVPGSKEILEETIEQLGKAPDHLFMDLGTGGTFGGVMKVLPEFTILTGIPVLKGVDWLKTLGDVVQKDLSGGLPSNINIIEDYHFGGFVKFNEELIQFINEFSSRYGIQLEPLYTGKLVYAFNDLVKKSYFPKGSSVVWVHSGGLQGIEGFNYLHGPKIIR